MRNSYEQQVRVICGDDWSSPDRTADERDGGFGVAIIFAFIDGVPCRLQDLSRALDVPSYLLEMAYKRLQMNGLFSAHTWVLSDRCLLSFGDNKLNIDERYECIRAWCFIAGMASGFTGKGCTREEYAAAMGRN